MQSLSSADCLEKVAALSSFIEQTTDQVQSLLKQLNWTADHVQQAETLVQCPFNSDHRMPEAALEDHTQVCRLVRKGYTREEAREAVSLQPYYQDSKTVIEIDDVTQGKILARCHGFTVFGFVSALLSILHNVLCILTITLPGRPDGASPNLEPPLSTEERLNIYNYCVAKSKETISTLTPDQLALLADPLKSQRNEDGSDKKSELELRAEQRDFKRRRQSYRAKNVHITKKSYTEVMKEVIANQMEILENIIKEKEEEKEEKEKESGRQRSRKRSRSRDRSRQRSKARSSSFRSEGQEGRGLENPDRAYREQGGSPERVSRDHGKSESRKRRFREHKEPTPQRSSKKSQRHSRSRSRDRSCQSSPERSSSRSNSERRFVDNQLSRQKDGNFDGGSEQTLGAGNQGVGPAIPAMETVATDMGRQGDGRQGDDPHLPVEDKELEEGEKSDSSEESSSTRYSHKHRRRSRDRGEQDEDRRRRHKHKHKKHKKHKREHNSDSEKRHKHKKHR